MGGSKPKAIQAPFQQANINTYGYMSPYGQPGVQEFLDTPLDFGDESDIDPGVGRRTDLAEQEVNNRYDSSFMSGVPAWMREIYRNKEKREVQGQGAYERQQADFYNKQANDERRRAKTLAELERRRALLPQL